VTTLGPHERKQCQCNIFYRRRNDLSGDRESQRSFWAALEAAKAPEGIETDPAVLEAASILTTLAYAENPDPSTDSQRRTPVGQGTLAQVHPASNEDSGQVSEQRWIRLGPAVRQVSGRRLPPASKLDSKVKKYPPRDPAVMLNKPAGAPEHITGFDAASEPARAPEPNQKRVAKSRKSTKRKKKLT